MDKASYILVASVQHTGTWFLLEGLKRHSKLDDYIMLNETQEWVPEPDKRYIQHIHVPIGDAGSPLNLPYPFTYMALDVMMRVLKTVIPLRDPLLSILSRHKRHPEMSHFFLVDGFTYLAQIPDCFFLPVDILRDSNDVEKRKRALSDLLGFLGLGVEPFVHEWAEQWGLVNENTVQYPELEWYQEGAVDKLKGLFPEEFDYLQAYAHIIKPFLSRHGYKDFIW